MRKRENEGENLFSVFYGHNMTQSERASERESKTARARESERARERERQGVRKRERDNHRRSFIDTTPQRMRG